MEKTGKAKHTEFRADIEGLRALAVGLVVAFHFGVHGVPGGFVGVDVFFVISGYLITGLLTSELNRTGGLDIVGFYARRTRRLLPVAFVVIAVTLLVGTFVLSPTEQGTAAKAAAASSLYFSNFWFMRQFFDYFSPEAALNPFLHTWSLSVEEQFYFVWPTFLLITTRLARGPLKRIAVIVFGVVTSFAACVWLAHVKQPWAFYSSPARVWEFGIGALATMVPTPRFLRRMTIAKVVAWAGVLSILGSAILLTESVAFPSWSALFPVLGTAAVLFAGGATSGRAIGLLATSPFQFIGKRSYAIYLWHWPIIVFALIRWPNISLFGRLACVLLTIGLSMLTLRLIETPIRTNAKLILRPAFSLGLAGLVTIAGAGVAVSVYGIAQHSAKEPAQQSFYRASQESSALLKPGCMLELSEIKPAGCTFDTEGADKTIVLFGDSHAAQWLTPIGQIAKSNHARLVTHLKSSCAVADVTVISTRLRRAFEECSEWRGEAIRAIIKLQPAAVIISQHSLDYVKLPGREGGASSVTADEWSSGLRQTLTEFERADIPVVVIADTPFMRFDVPTCLARAESHRLTMAGCQRTREDALSEDVSAAERAAISGTTNAHYVDMSDLFCAGDVCPPQKFGDIVYRDTNHITESYAAKIAPEMLQRVEPFLFLPGERITSVAEFSPAADQHLSAAH